ncbi:SemiSWEET transporter [Candidatus Bathyarchaeota archaeon]|nr:SemiSWEET transporter [Candidatus Bathyarchaeota archaeon]
MDYITIIGLTAAAMGGISLFPQVLKVLKTKSTKDISREMILILAGSIFLWLVYGILLKNLPIVIANSFGFIQALIILFFKIKNQLKKRARAGVERQIKIIGYFIVGLFH